MRSMVVASGSRALDLPMKFLEHDQLGILGRMHALRNG